MKNKKIHVIRKDYDIIFSLVTIELEKLIKKNKNIRVLELKDYINEKDFFGGSIELFFDDNYKKYIISNYGRRSQKINWRFDFNKLKLAELFEVLNVDEIMIEAVYDETGDESGVDPLSIIDTIKFIWNLIKNIKLYLAYKSIEKHSGYSKDFIERVILLNNNWKLGFLFGSNEKSKIKKEKLIMQSLKYKLEDNYWKNRSWD